MTRDRSRIYREGMAKGAPQAVQVADRWHLLRGLALALEEFLLRKRPALRDAASEAEDAVPEGAVGVSDPTNRPGSWWERKGEAAKKRHERLVGQWEDIRRLHLAGADVRFIAKKLGVGARTVYRRISKSPRPARPTPRGRASWTPTCPIY